MKSLWLGCALLCSLAQGAQAQEMSRGEILQGIENAIQSQESAAPSHSATRGLQRSIVNENGVDAERAPRDDFPSPAPTEPDPAAPPAGKKGCTVAAKFDTLLFTTGSDAISSDYNTQRTLMELVATLKDPKLTSDPTLSRYRFRIRGHTDPTGKLEMNLLLSQRRADNIVAFLKAHGAPSNKLTAEGRGPFELARPDDPTNKQNRRVDVCVEGV